MTSKNPHQIADERIGMAEEYSRYSGEYAKLIKKQADFFNANRSKHKSDTATQRAFESTEDGVTMAVIKLKLKSIEKQLSASNTMLRLMENESKGLY
jgi:hypothetical protein